MDGLTVNDVSTIVLGAIAVIGCIVGMLSYNKNSSVASRKQAEEWGELRADISHIKSNMEEMKASLETARKQTDVAITRVYERMDEKFVEHEKIYHAK